jgi:hypothetical protein
MRTPCSCALQVHLLKDGSIKIFSRNSEDNTSKYPDLITMLPAVMRPGTESFVIDSEVVAYDTETSALSPLPRPRPNPQALILLPWILAPEC